MKKKSVEISLPKFQAQVEIVKDKKRIRDVYLDSPPGELMDECKKVIGDGLARVTVSSEMAAKTYGNGVSAHVSVSLTCGQDTDTIDKAVMLAGRLSLDYAKMYREMADKEFQNSLGPQVQKPNYGG